MNEEIVNIENCQNNDYKWQCPDEQCRKILSRKQTLIEHINSFHSTLLIVVEGQRGKYKQYESNTSVERPKSTLYASKKRPLSAHLNEETLKDADATVLPTATDRDDEEESFDSEMDIECGSEFEPEHSLYVASSNDEEESDDENYDPQMNRKNKSGPPLYVIPPQEDLFESSISKTEHVMAIAAYATRHNLSNVAIKDLLNVVRLHLPTSNTAVSSVQTLKEECGFDRHYLTHNLFCGMCKKSTSDNEEICSTPGCTGTSASNAYFVTADIGCQLKELLERPGIWASIQEGTDISTSVISDIRSGDEYRKLKQPGAFLHNSNNISLSMFTDGVPLFKSSSVSLWPVYLLVNELPQKDRFLCSNMILWGIWQGSGKPNMVSFLKPLVQNLNCLYHEGFEFVNEGQSIHSRAMLLVMTMDLQARAYILQMTHHNGEYGCLYCLHQGQSVASGAGHCRSYQYQEHLEMRTEESIREHAKEARNSRKRVMGFYGETVFMYLTYFSLMNNVVIDYMHGALLGVVKKFMEIWFDAKFAKEAWYIGSHTKSIDRHLQSIKPPYFIHRRPRAITNTYHHWKASELRNWLLFYSLPCLIPYLERVYILHFSSLVEGIYILLGEGIEPDQINRANMLLCAFTKNVELLYGQQFMSMNVHNLVHYSDMVRRWGPLWCWSCFPYESFNGTIMDTIHGTGNVCKDIFWQMQAKKRVERKLVELPYSSTAKEQITKMLKSKTYTQKHGNAKQCHVVKPTPLKTMTESETIFLQSEFGTTDLSKFNRSFKIIHNGFTMYSRETEKVKKQNSYTIMMNNYHAIEVDRYIANVDTKQVFASGFLVKLIDSILPNRVPHIHKMTRLYPVVVAITDLREPLVVIADEKNTCIYAALLPNHHETD